MIFKWNWSIKKVNEGVKFFQITVELSLSMKFSSTKIEIRIQKSVLDEPSKVCLFSLCPKVPLQPHLDIRINLLYIL